MSDTARIDRIVVLDATGATSRVPAAAPARSVNQPRPAPRAQADATEPAGGAAGEPASAGGCAPVTAASISEGAAVTSFSRPDWWGEDGCRRDGEPGHTCLDVWGHAPADSCRPCVAEQRAAMAETFERYRAVG